jgi:inosine-uridine nucleoside N-ribohydrolase
MQAYTAAGNLIQAIEISYTELINSYRSAEHPILRMIDAVDLHAHVHGISTMNNPSKPTIEIKHMPRYKV